jgi:hypothetical protein
VTAAKKKKFKSSAGILAGKLGDLGDIVEVDTSAWFARARRDED